MGKKLRYSLGGLVVLFLAIQLIPVNRDNPTTDASLEIKAPVEVMKIIKNSCYDCHSNKTEWPFYSYIAPLSWLVAGDVEHGREELNFSEWYKMPAEKISRKKEKLVEEVMEGKMPLPIYLYTHSNAELDEMQKQVLRGWVNQSKINKENEEEVELD